jgi:hypothetical protein
LNKTKKCKDCLEIKSINEFKFTLKLSKTLEEYKYYEPRCIPCLKIFTHINYMKNREKNIASSKKYYEQNWQQQRDYQNQYKKDRRTEMLDYYTRYYWDNHDHLTLLAREYREENKEYYNEYGKRRRELVESLPINISENEIKLVFELFSNKCALSESDNEVTLEHFIPVSWGHGGTYIGNIYPLNISLNQSKRNVNPFEWAKKERVQNEVDYIKWDKLITYLANENKITYEEFIEFIYWCESNQRDVEQVRLDGDISSLELWKLSKFQ